LTCSDTVAQANQSNSLLKF